MTTDMTSHSRRGLLSGLAISLVLAAGALSPPPARAADPLPGDSVYQLPVRLTDHAGRSRDWGHLRGTPRVATMFYTSCQYICPLIVESTKAVDRQLPPAERERLGYVLVSLDPGRDTPAALARVVETRGLDGGRWLLASPPAGSVRAVAGVLGIRYRPLADGEFNHTSELVLLDADGRILARTDEVGTRPDPAFIAAVRRAVAAERPEGPQAAARTAD